MLFHFSSPVFSVRINSRLAVSFEFRFSLVCATQYINQHKTDDGENEAWQELDDDCVYPEVDPLLATMINNGWREKVEKLK